MDDIVSLKSLRLHSHLHEGLEILYDIYEELEGKGLPERLSSGEFCQTNLTNILDRIGEYLAYHGMIDSDNKL